MPYDKISTMLYLRKSIILIAVFLIFEEKTMLQKKTWKLNNVNWEKWVTRYTESNCSPKARIFYFHGGGLLYGSRNDLPKKHLELLTQAGYEILAFDYPLAPSADLEMILNDVCSSINGSCEMDAEFTNGALPYFLWGRSAGAYLCLIAAASGMLNRAPDGILSYYGYGFLCDNWFCTPSSYYLTLPRMDESCLKHIPQTIHANGSLDSHYSVYVYARQTGNWKNLIYNGREKYFFTRYSLRTCDYLPCPLFAAHAIGDTDVPYSEFLELCSRYQAQRFIASGNIHDFDRNQNDPFTVPLLSATIQFLEKRLL